MKTIFRELLAMIVIVAAAGLITVLIFFDYIKADVNQPQAAIYETSKKEKSILEEKEKYEEDKDTLVLSSAYSIGENELSNMKASGEFQQGQASPFDEIPITDIRVDSEGNVYYQTNATANNNNSGSSNTGNNSSSPGNNNSTGNNNSGNNTNNNTNNTGNNNTGNNSNNNNSNNSNNNNNNNNTNNNTGNNSNNAGNNNGSSNTGTPSNGDITSPSAGTGNLQVTQKTGGGK